MGHRQLVQVPIRASSSDDYGGNLCRHRVNEHRSTSTCRSSRVAAATPAGSYRKPVMKLKTLTQLAVLPSPAPSASAPEAPPSLLPLTHFDIFWYPLKPVQRVYFYSLPGLSLSDFLDTHVPAIEHSLSLTLRRFLPLAGRLVRSAAPEDDGSAGSTTGVPCLRYTQGDTVQLAVVEVESDDQFSLATLTADGFKPAAVFRALVARLEPAPVPPPEQGLPVLALQLSLFPSQGFSLGISMQHAAMDGSTVSLFMRTWSTICRCGDANVKIDMPSFDRSVIEDPGRSMARELKELAERNIGDGSVEAMDLSPNPDILRCTVRFSSTDFENLRRRLCRNGSSSPRFSSFALATALVWTTVLKARAADAGADTTCTADGKDGDEWFVFACDLRSRLGVPQRYFGNLLGACYVKGSRAELTGPDGLAVAASLLRDTATGLQGPDGLRRALQRVKDGIFEVYRLIPFTVAGSPRLAAYSVDFGWGRPVKTEVVSIDTTSAMSIAESPDGDQGGVEVGVVLPAKHMHAFADLLPKALHGHDDDGC